VPRLTKLESGDADPSSRELFDRFLRERGNVPNMFRTAAHRPEILRTLIEHFTAVMTSGTVSRRLKEMVSVRVSHLNACEY
jgi:alkylhydroperoxidase family enzyme